MKDEETKELRSLMRDIYETRSNDICWFPDADGDYGDCGNWDTCPEYCPIRRLAAFAGIPGHKDGSVYRCDIERR